MVEGGWQTRGFGLYVLGSYGLALVDTSDELDRRGGRNAISHGWLIVAYLQALNDDSFFNAAEQRRVISFFHISFCVCGHFLVCVIAIGRRTLKTLLYFACFRGLVIASLDSYRRFLHKQRY